MKENTNQHLIDEHDGQYDISDAMRLLPESIDHLNKIYEGDKVNFSVFIYGTKNITKLFILNFYQMKYGLSQFINFEKSILIQIIQKRNLYTKKNKPSGWAAKHPSSIAFA